MKRSTHIVLAAVFAAAISSCRQREDEWMSGQDSRGRYRDTVSNNHPYRFYGGLWYPIYNGMISPTTYQGATYNQIRNPGFRPSRSASFRSRGGSFRSGGFGSSSHSSAGS